MKKEIHPAYYPEARIRCACGNRFVTGATVPEIEVEVCAACHPFFTGKGKMIDTAGKVEKFQRRIQKRVALGLRGGKQQRQAKRQTQRKEKLQKKLAKEAKEIG